MDNTIENGWEQTKAHGLLWASQMSLRSFTIYFSNFLPIFGSDIDVTILPNFAVRFDDKVIKNISKNCLSQ